MTERDDQQLQDVTTPASSDVESTRSLGGRLPDSGTDVGKPADADVDTLASIPDSATTGSERERSPNTILDVAQGTTGLLGAGRPASESLFDE